MFITFSQLLSNAMFARGDDMNQWAEEMPEYKVLNQHYEQAVKAWKNYHESLRICKMEEVK